MNNQTTFGTSISSAPAAGLSFSAILWLAGIFIVPMIRLKFADDNILPHRFLGWAVLCFALLLIRRKSIAVSLQKLWLSVRTHRAAAMAAGGWFIYLLFSMISGVNSVNKPEWIFEICKLFTMSTFALISFDILSERKQAFEWFSRLLTVLVLVLSFIGVMQFYELGFMKLCEMSVMPCSLMGNRNLLASFLMMCLPVVFFLVFAGSQRWRWLAMATTGISLYVILLSQTRTSYVILALLVVMLLVYLFLKRSRAINAKSLAIAAVAGLLLIAGVLSQKRFSLKDRLLSGIEINGDARYNSVAERLWMANKTVAMIKDHWLTGVGAGNWKVNLSQYGLQGSRMDQGVVNFLQPHNDYLWIGAETGLPGLLGYLLFVIGLLAMLWQTLRQPDKADQNAVFGLLLALVAFSIDAALSFPRERIEHALMLSLLAAAIWAFYHPQKSEVQKNPSKSGVISWAIVGGMAVVLIFAWIRSGNDLKIYQLKQAYNSNQDAVALQTIDRINTSVTSLDCFANPVKMYKGLIETRTKQYDNAIQSFLEAQQANPGSVAGWNQLAYVFYMKKDYPSGIRYYEKALQYSPDFQSSIVGLSLLHYEQKNVAKALEIIKKGDPNNEQVAYFTKMYQQGAR